ncbi:MAG: molybdate ABC transporter substrate-binding protein [Campylobacterota bacterium]|nr:molybdate ABC transporter substrate-binding protein [Campylobacterota bacterium]
MRKLLLLSILTLSLFTLSYAQEEDKKPAFVFAAGNLKFVFPQMIKEFYALHQEARVYIQYGSSGNLAATILEGKNYHIFFSADTKYPQKIYDAGKSASKPKLYARGTLILFIPKIPDLGERKIHILNSQDINNITIANTSSSPYGVAALETLTNAKCCKKVMHKIRYSSDVATAIDNVIWNGDAGFLSKSALHMIPDHRKTQGVDWIEIDENLYNPIIQAYVVSKDGLKNENSVKFLDFIESEAGQKIFLENGYKKIH